MSSAEDDGYEVAAPDEEAALDVEEEGGAVATKPPEEPQSNVPKGYATAHSTDLEFSDHFSLRKPSSKIRFRNRDVRVYNLVNDQLQLEHHEEQVAIQGGEDDDDDDDKKLKKQQKHQFTIKRMRGGSFGLRALRTMYTLVALLMAGFCFIFSTQVILFQILEIPQYDGQGADDKLNIRILVATLFSLPLLCHSMGSLMVLVTAFVCDIWNGNTFYGMLTGLSNVAMEWYCFVLYVVVPALAVIITTFAREVYWFETSALVWYCSMLLSFFIFCALVFFHEIKFCFDLMKLQYPNDNIVELARRALVITLSQRFCGIRDERYLVNESSDPANLPNAHPFSTYIGPYSQTTLLSCNPIFDQLDPPQRRYTTEEIRDSAPIITNRSWSIEQQFCRRRFARTVFAVSGEDALQHSHFASTLACAVIGAVLLIGVVVGVLYWMEMGTAIYVVAAVAIACVILVPLTLSQFTLNLLHPANNNDDDDNDNDDDDDDDDKVLYQVWISFMVAKPKEWYCWFRFFIDLAFLYLFPMISMYMEGLPKNATLFLGLGFFSGLRIYFDASLVMAELGSLSDVKFPTDDVSSGRNDERDKTMVKKARASEVMGKVTASKTIWLWVLAFLVVGLMYLLQAINSTEADGPVPQGGRTPIRLLDDFYYPPQEDLSYPTCKLAKGFDFVPEGFTYLYDYNMLAAMAYETPNVTDYILDKWFGAEDVVIDETPFVSKWRKDTNNDNSPVSFKLFSVPSVPGLGIVSIRGTQTADDRLLNAQLYMSSIMTQLLRAVLPFGWVWSDIYDDLIASVAWIGSDQLQRGAYYRVTTQFVNDLLHNNYTVDGKSFDTLRTTGVSLGGGIALITGAQTGAYTVAIAGVNPTLARLTFDPPLTTEAIKTKILNVVPERDFISAIGDPPRLTQKIACRTPISNVGGCHSFWRVWCEFLFACGSRPRPVPCICTQYDFPEPIQNGTRPYKQACDEEEAIVSQYG